MVMKVTNERKGIFSCYSHNMNEINSMRAIFITVNLMFLLKVFIVNKNKDTHHKYQQLHTLHCIWYPILGRFLLIFKTRLPVYELITQLIKM